MLTLDDVPRLVGKPACLTAHGLGRGGGEAVALQMVSILGLEASQVLVHRDGPLAVLVGVLKHRRQGHALCTAGPRDGLAMSLSALLGRRADVYLQVPYLRSISWRDPVHAAVVLMYLLLVMLLARHVLVNSAQTGEGLLFRRRQVLVPVTRSALTSVDARQRPCVTDSIYWVCRLYKERGRGSRDLAGMRRLGGEVAQAKHANPQHKLDIVHFGECSEPLRHLLQRETEGAIQFLGYDPDWLSRVNGVVVFLSNYEGFGLAAFEAARAGLRVCVNEAFPSELLALTPNIHRIRSLDASCSILKQLHDLGSTYSPRE